MKKFTLFVTTLFLLCSVSSSLAALEPPVVSSTADGVDITIDWTSVAGATGYTLYYAPVTDSGYGTISSKDMGASTTFNYTLWEGALFAIAVKAYNGQESSLYSNIDTISIPYTTAPDSPQLSSNLDGTTLNASWGSVLNATGYRLYYTLSAYTGQEAFLPVGVGNQTSFSYQGLTEGQTYSIAVVAYNDFGESDFSNVAQFTVEVAPASTPSIVGAWRTTAVQDDFLAFNFYDDGTYTHMEVDFSDQSEISGMEWGTYSIDETTGQMTVTQTFDNNGDTGLTDFIGVPNLFAHVESNVLTLSFDENGDGTIDGSLELNRVESTASVVGPWRTTAVQDDFLAFNFYDDGTYTHMEVDFSDQSEISGMEWGTYSIDETTGQMTVTQTFDNNGDTGLTDFIGVPNLFAHVESNVLTLSFDENGDGTIDGSFEVQRQ